MNRKMLVVALSAACASPLALADVTIYGTLNNSLESVKATGAANSANDVKSTSRVSSNTSKIGFKGNEDLGNGLKAIWQVEQEVSIDDGGTRKGNWATRNTFVGLDGRFGQVMLGNYDSAYKMVKYLIPLEDGVADFTGANGIIGRGQQRMKNSVQYRSPNFSGFSFGASYGTDETRAVLANSERTNAQAWALAAQYNANGLLLGGAFERRDDTGAVAGASKTTDHQDFWKAVARYKFADTELGLGYEYENQDRIVGADQKQSAWSVSATQKFGNFGLGLAYVSLGKRKGAGSGSISDADYKANQWSLSGTYDLSKRTQAYAFYTRIDNKNAAKINFDSNGITGVAAGSNPTAFGIGLSHKF